MKVHQTAPNLKKPARKRKGQGNATGNGTYGGRGMNGQNARAGGGVRQGFEGGQTPLIQRMPKRRGFKNPNRVETQAVDLGQIEAVYKDGESVNLGTLIEKGLVNNPNKKVKILASGELSKKVTVEGVPASKTAVAAIEKAGGKFVAPKVEKAEEK